MWIRKGVGIMREFILVGSRKIADYDIETEIIIGKRCKSIIDAKKYFLKGINKSRRDVSYYIYEYKKQLKMEE